MLSSLQLKLSYRSGSEDVVSEFLTPCMEEAELYQRAAGYFTSHGLALAARGVANLASRGGRMQLVVSPHLEATDVAALQKALHRPREVLQSILSGNLLDIEDAILKDRLNALAWLAASGLLEIRIALRVNENNQIARGLYHEKVGIFTDNDGNAVAFSGSSNETAGGLLENFESIEVFCSWQGESNRIEAKKHDFEALWEDNTPGLKVLEFSDAAAELLERFRDPAKPPVGIDISKVAETRPESGFKPPAWLTLHDYQEEAIKAWAEKEGKGIFAMATGSGKTLTALSLACRVAKKNSPMVIIVVCPFINLCNQWIGEIAAFNLRSIPCFEGRQRWESLIAEAYQSVSAGLEKAVALVTTTHTFQSPAFQSQLRARVSSQHHRLMRTQSLASSSDILMALST